MVYRKLVCRLSREGECAAKALLVSWDQESHWHGKCYATSPRGNLYNMNAKMYLIHVIFQFFPLILQYIVVIHIIMSEKDINKIYFIP